jgi:RNA polymerase sigma-70 factor, ECF subfamily
VTAERSDEELLAAFQAGDDRAFDALVSRYERRVWAICYRYFGNAADAEDAAQDAFVALLRRGSTFTGQSSFSTWMFRVATNACNDLARKRARRPQRDGTDVERLPEGDPRLHVQGADAQLDGTRIGPELQAALQVLDPASREAVVLHDVYGVPYADIAERSGVAVGTVKSRINRAHARLVEALRAGDAGEPATPSRPPTTRP